MSVVDPAREGAQASAEGQWDVIVIGTGMGGAVIGHSLTEAGFRVLFLEKGHATIASGPLDGDAGAAQRAAAGHWPEPVRVTLDGVSSDMLLPLGSGVGGSTNLYSAALERFERSDIEPVAEMPHPTGGWPVEWSEWGDHYGEAERRLRVRGRADPRSQLPATLLPPAVSSQVDRRLSAVLRRNGLNPYSLHVGIAYRPDCSECGGHKCPAACKSDAQVMFVDPALTSGLAQLYSDCEVLRIDADERRVQRVIIRQDGVERSVSARIVVLSAGACHSPALLLRSKNAHWPTGLANRSGLVGRNLMFHANEWLAVWPPARLSLAGPRKTIGVRDHYREGNMRLGSIQSTGLAASYGNICAFLMGRLATSRWRRVTGADKLLKLAAAIAVRLFGNATIFVMIVEDFGLPGNRVTLDPDDPGRIRIDYTVDGDLAQRARRARKVLKRSFRGLKTLSLQNSVSLNLGHASGTCRFGTDPATSVLDPDCRAHGIDNLYVVDASFMPSSGGTNPALTIAANALRVAALLSRRLTFQAPSEGWLRADGSEHGLAGGASVPDRRIGGADR